MPAGHQAGRPVGVWPSPLSDPVPGTGHCGQERQLADRGGRHDHS